MVKAGLGRNSAQRFKCQTCGKRFSEPQQKPFGADVRLPQETVCRILHCLVEGNSARGTARLCDVEKRTVLNVLALAGENCERLLAERMRDVPIQDVQCDEIWSFVGKKEGHKRPSETDAQEIGDAYTFIAIESNSKLIFAWHLGKRTLPHTEAFITKIRLVTGDSRFQISTDGFRPSALETEASAKDGEVHRYKVALGLEAASKGNLIELTNDELRIKSINTAARQPPIQQTIQGRFSARPIPS